MPRILIVDDDLEIRGTMASLLRRQQIDFDQAENLRATRSALETDNYDLLLLDVNLPDGSGLSLLPELRSMANPPEVIILTGKGDPEGAELAIEGGVWDYLVKPASIKDISLSINRALKYKDQRDRSIPRALDLSRMIGTSRAMRECFEVIAQAAVSDANVLITGETGVGKELAARTIHVNSRRAKCPFVVVDCASLTDSLMESTLFGHRKGAFTGAFADREGLVRQAHTGVLFLDELGELPLAMQKSLLRVLQERKFRPIGENREQESDFRLIAATNQDLEELVDYGTFRRDLYFRIKTIRLRIPPLRDRREDIKPLATSFIEQLCRESGIKTKVFGSDFFSSLQDYDWPGNVRELGNVVERALVAAGEEKFLYAMHLPKDLRIKVARSRIEQGAAMADDTSSSCLDIVDFGADFPSLKSFKRMNERRYLEALIRKTGGDVPQILTISGLSRSHFYALLKKYELEA
ncbi:two-component system, NtrC family, response regulator [Desulfonatronum thiosulfatophilum]|uniref:Two-component system, NtrC family, response regulator n=1 Tax=Desulfonatronum thiosulfatophilum TaxID=617002 RepID=A0A1G6CU12_9BACT|nr:sigma-54 dependent transcriptional regulator [Desulfonatronum thiosulfatophilum]SDB36379.1 two-component system, NtrC family, response regulator [Desulfonatronum thiosulfatophilum]